MLLNPLGVYLGTRGHLVSLFHMGFNLGTRGHLGGLGFRGGHGGICWLVSQLTYGEPLGGDLGAYVNWRRATPVCCHMQASLKTRGRGSNFSFASLLHMLASILIHRLGPQKVRPSWLCSKVIRQGSKQSHVTWNGWFTKYIGAIGLKICSHKYTAAKKTRRLASHIFQAKDAKPHHVSTTR